MIKWNIYPVDIKIKPDSKPLSSRYYLVPHINKETFQKELASLVQIVVFTPVKQSEYGTSVFIIAKKEGTKRFLTDLRQVKNTIA